MKYIKLNAETNEVLNVISSESALNLQDWANVPESIDIKIGDFYDPQTQKLTNPLPIEKIKLDRYCKEIFDQILQEKLFFCPIERESFADQKAEYQLYLNNPDDVSLTPNCNEIALNRGIGRTEFMTKLGQKTEAYKSIRNQYLGQQQAFSDRIDSAPDFAELGTIRRELNMLIND